MREFLSMLWDVAEFLVTLAWGLFAIWVVAYTWLGIAQGALETVAAPFILLRALLTGEQ